MEKLTLSEKELERLENVDFVLLECFRDHPTFFNHVISECSDEEFNKKYTNLFGRWLQEKISSAEIVIYHFYKKYYIDNFYEKIDITLDEYLNYVKDEMKKHKINNIKEVIISEGPFRLQFDKSFNDFEFYIEKDEEPPEDVVNVLALNDIKKKIFDISDRVFLKSRLFKTIYPITKEMVEIV